MIPIKKEKARPMFNCMYCIMEFVPHGEKFCSSRYGGEPNPDTIFHDLKNFP